ncbi:MAG: putative capsid protein [Circoviridae sp.]|nr:MAG: putative capsid protein [Circoviridae sp.]
MPPVRTRPTRITDYPRVFKRRKRLFNKSSKPRTYKTGNKGKRSTALLKIATNVPIYSRIRLRYNQTMLVRQAGTEQYRFRVLMNNPTGTVNANKLVTENTNAFVTSTNSDDTLYDEQLELFGQYDHAVVESSTATMSARPYGGNALATDHFTNQTDAQGNHFLQTNPPTQHGDLMAWTVNTDAQHALVSTVIPVETLRNDIPGVKQRSFVALPNRTKGVKFTAKYNPKTSFGIKDIGDNQQRIGYNQNGSPTEQAYAEFGFQPTIPHSMVGTGPTLMPPMYVQFQIDYVIKFTERKPQNNTVRPSGPHFEL